MSFLAEDVIFQFGNAPPVKGATAVRAAVGVFFESLQGLHHDVREAWEAGDTDFCHGWVTYIRKDGRPLAVPFALVLGRRGGKISEYLIFVDASPLFRGGP